MTQTFKMIKEKTKCKGVKKIKFIILKILPFSESLNIKMDVFLLLTEYC